MIRLALCLALLLLGGAAHAQEVTGLPRDEALPIRVATAIRVIDISQVQETAGLMAARIELTYRWQDGRQAFDRVREAQAQKNFFGEAAIAQLRRMWQPAVDVENLSGAARQDQTGLTIDSSGAVTLVRRLDASFRVAIDMSSFPFDAQALDIILTSNRHGAREVLLVHTAADAAHSAFAARLQTPLWTIRRLDVRNAAYAGWNGAPHSRLTFTIEAQRLYTQYLIRIFLPFLTLMSSTLVILWSTDQTMPLAPKGALAFTTLLALVALSFTFESNFPGSMSTGTPIARIISTGYLYIVSVLFLNMFLLNKDFVFARRAPGMFAEIGGFVRWGLPVAVFLYWTALILRAVV
ncbi:ligand-gated ion channel [Plastoroseomonas arctica]|uniref:Neurotransmitter-gated ion-channel ligand-binding domain-containing protein n=1 Tax=Plastoroseomonas arctica TaxID=1509237 RepID=A0AAF1KM31_9PROT|nr:hypothetical protein [Plastoroseomonas arctica]